MRHDNSHSRRPDSNHGDDWRRRTHGTSYERDRKRSRSRSCDREGVRQSRDPGVDARTLRRDRSESQTLASSPGPSSPALHSKAVKGKGKAVELGGATNGFSPPTGGSEAERAAIDKSLGSAQIGELPNTEHTVIGISKCGNRDRAPKALTLRQSVRAHLSLQKTELLKVSRSAAGPKSKTLGPDLQHCRPSLLERILGMEEDPHNQLPSVSTVHPGFFASPDSTRPPRSAAVQPEQYGAASSNINIDCTGEDTIDIDSHRLDPISNTVDDDSTTAQAECADRAPRVDPMDVLERTRIRLAKIKNVMVAGIPPTAPTPPPIPLDPSTPGEPEEIISPAPVVATLRNKLLERLESERERAIGAASREPEVEPVAGNISEDSLKAELRARNQLRARLAVVKADRHVGVLEP